MSHRDLALGAAVDDLVRAERRVRQLEAAVVIYREIAQAAIHEVARLDHLVRCQRRTIWTYLRPNVESRQDDEVAA